MRDNKELIKFSTEIRILVLELIYKAKASHIGSAFSIIDLLVVLYKKIMKYDINNPKNNDRDFFILSKGHSGAAVYAVLSNLGFFDRKFLMTYYQDGSYLSGHISHKYIPGIEVSTGSLGQGLGYALGMAFSFKLDNKSNQVYCIIGDGECNEGTFWEMITFASHHKLDNLTIILDKNNQQGLGSNDDIISLKNLDKVLINLGWNVEVIDGHNLKDIFNALKKVIFNKPKFIVANTIKGKGVTFMENNLLWHYRNPNEDEYNTALKELMNKL